MPQLYFSNPGEIDQLLISTLGVNVKEEGSSPIGYFGTGLKFAIAVVLRGRGSIVIHSGLRRLSFHAEPRQIRGKEFQLVVMEENGARTPLSFTTDLGRNWEPWMAVRELWSNAKDEGGSSGEGPENPAPGRTVIEVKGDLFLQAWHERWKWLLESNPKLEFPELSVHEGRSQFGFYQGLRVTQWGKPSLYSYNCKASLRLTEDRTCQSTSFFPVLTKTFAMQCEDRGVLKDLLLAPDLFFEHDLDWTWGFGKPSPTFVSVIEELYDGNYATLNRSAVRLCENFMTKRIPAAAALTRVEEIMLSRALGFLAKMGHEVKEPITVVDTLGSQWIAGLASEGRIYLPKASFGKGTKFLASTLLEEHLHLSQGLADESRAMQDWLFDKVVSLMEELNGEPV